LSHHAHLTPHPPFPTRRSSDLTPAERRNLLASYFEPSEEDRQLNRKLPTLAHHAIARLVAAGYIRLILTTNFDPLIETALESAGDRKSTRLNSSHQIISYAVFC